MRSANVTLACICGLTLGCGAAATGRETGGAWAETDTDPATTVSGSGGSGTDGPSGDADDSSDDSGDRDTEPGDTTGPEPPCDIPDEDGDGVCDLEDNCPDVPNPDQARSDGNDLGDACMWPNDLSWANSDPWIAEHHDDLRKMAPRFLAINFANGLGLGGGDNVDGGSVDAAYLEAKAQGFLDDLSEASRFHGYDDSSAIPFLEPRLAGVVDLQDDNGHANSDAFPRGSTDAEGRPLVGYRQLFEPTFAAHLGYYDDDLDRYLTLGELVERGEVHEVLMIANQVDGIPENPPGEVTLQILEVAFVAQGYDAELAPIPGAFVKNGVAFEQQGNEDPTAFIANSMAWSEVGRSLRIYFLNVSRGTGCLMHSLGHEFEFRYNESRIYAPAEAWHEASVNPYVQPQFRAFADFDMQGRYGAPFDSLYAGSNDYTYGDCGADGCTTLHSGGTTITEYAPRCGNTHYPPGATFGYDYYPSASVPSSCESFAGPGSATTPSDPSRWQNLPVDDDCGGRFLTYWYQNMPGLGATGTAPDGQPLRNWWPFMYY